MGLSVPGSIAERLDAPKNQLQTPASAPPLPTLLWLRSKFLGPAPANPSRPAAAHTPFFCLRLSQVSGGCPKFRHIWPLQKDPHLSGHSEFTAPGLLSFLGVWEAGRVATWSPLPDEEKVSSPLAF